MEMKHFEVGTMKLEIHASEKAAGEAAARSRRRRSSSWTRPGMR